MRPSRYVHCLCSSKTLCSSQTHSILSNEKSKQDSFNEPSSQYFVTKISGPANYHQGLCPSVIKAYADQYTRAWRQLRLLDRPGGCEHLKYDRFKMYIDQGVHFQIRINKSILLIHSISPVCKTKYFEMRAPNQLTSKYVLLHRDVRLSFGSYFETC